MATRVLSQKQSAQKPVSKHPPGFREGVSIWSATTERSAAPSLDKNIDADVCIVGAGIAGMTTAYLLAREGKSVVILDKGQIGSGETAHTSAHLSNVIDAGYREIEAFTVRRRSIGRPKPHRSDCPN
jgi:hypothetical protein